jgi:hypothetical protein
MADIQDYIDQERTDLLATKAATPQLAVYTNPSATARWRMLIYAMAVAAAWLRGKWDEFKAEIDAILTDRAAVGTLAWYRRIAFEFQYSASTTYVLTEDTAGPLRPITYTVVDLEARIITRCSPRKLPDNRLEIKVAKGPDAALAALDAPELAAFTAYIDRRGLPVTHEVVSLPVTEVALTAEVLYDGVASAASVQTAVEAALDAFFAALNTRDNFGGTLYAQRLTDAIQAVTGVIDVTLSGLTILPSTPVLTRALIPAGYARRGPVTITYTPASPY